METKRLIIRKFIIEDFDDFIGLIRDKMKSEFSIYDEQFPTDHEHLRRLLSYFAESDEFFAIEKKDIKKVVGYISLNRVSDAVRNLGYCIHTRHQREGIATEAVIEIQEYAKEKLGILKLVSGTAEENIPSVNLLKRTGFQLVGKQQGSFVNDEKGDPICFSGCMFECVL